MRWNDNSENDSRSTFRSDANRPGYIGFAALRLRALRAQTGNPTFVPSHERGDSDSNPAC
jgi:hypothetical protein